MTLYEELELTPECSFEDIKHQYRTLAGIHHPDKGGDEEKFKRIKFAYEVLSDPVRRKQYDENKTTDVPHDKRHEAINQLSHIFASIIGNFDPNSGANLVELIKQEIGKQAMLIIADMNRCENYISKLETTKEKIRMKNDTEENILATFTDTQIEYRRKDLEVFKYRLSVGELMSQIIDDYQFGLIELPIFMETETKTQ